MTGRGDSLGGRRTRGASAPSAPLRAGGMTIVTCSHEGRHVGSLEAPFEAQGRRDRRDDRIARRKSVRGGEGGDELGYFGNAECVRAAASRRTP